MYKGHQIPGDGGFLVLGGSEIVMKMEFLDEDGYL